MISWSVVEKSPELVGRRVSIYWPGDDEWYEGVVHGRHNNKGYQIKYDDGESEWIKKLDDEKIKFLESHEDDDECVEGNNTNEGLEHEVKSCYEAAIMLLNESDSVGDSSWMTAKESLISLVADNSLLMTSPNLSDRMQRIKYFTYKNLCQIEEKSDEHEEALAYGLSALQMMSNTQATEVKNRHKRMASSTVTRPLIPHDTLLIARVASLACLVGDLWTCHALLFSGVLNKCMDHVKLELYKKWSNAMATSNSSVEPAYDIVASKAPRFTMTVEVFEDNEGILTPRLVPLLDQLHELCQILEGNSRSTSNDSTVDNNNMSDMSVFDSIDIDIKVLKAYDNPKLVPLSQNKRSLEALLSDNEEDTLKKSPTPEEIENIKKARKICDDEIASVLSDEKSDVIAEENSESALLSTEVISNAVSGANIQQEGEVAQENNERSSSTDNKKRSLPASDRVTRRQRQQMMREKGDNDGLNYNFSEDTSRRRHYQNYDLGSVEWEKQVRGEFEEIFSRVQNVVQCKNGNENGSSNVDFNSSNTENPVTNLIKMLRSDSYPNKAHVESPKTVSTQRFFAKYMPVACRQGIFLSVASIPLPSDILNHQAQRMQRKWAQSHIDNKELCEIEQPNVADLEHHTVTMTPKCSTPCSSDRNVYLADTQSGKDWVDLLQLLSFQQQLGGEGDVHEKEYHAHSSARIIDIFLGYLSCISKAVSNFSSTWLSSNIHGDNTDKMETSVGHMSTLRTVVLAAWREISMFHGGTVESVISVMADDEALVLGECILHNFINMQPAETTSIVPNTMAETLFLLLRRWDFMHCSESYMYDGCDVEGKVRRIRILWLIYHSMTHLPLLIRNLSINDEFMNDFSPDPFMASCAVLQNLKLLLNEKTLFLPHLQDSNAPDCNRDKSALPIAAITNVSPLAIVNRTAIVNVLNKKESDFLVWVQKRITLESDNSSTDHEQNNFEIDASLWSWLSSVQKYVCLPFSNSPSSVEALYSLRSLYQPYLLSPSAFMEITAVTLAHCCNTINNSCKQADEISTQGNANEVSDMTEGLKKILAQCRYSFLLVLLDTAVDCLAHAVNASSDELNSEIEDRAEVWVRHLILVLSTIETYGRDSLLATSKITDDNRRVKALLTTQAVFLFLTSSLSKLPVQYFSKYELQEHLNFKLLCGLEILVNEWLLIAYSSLAIQDKAQNTNFLRMRDGILAFVELLFSLKILPMTRSSVNINNLSIEPSMKAHLPDTTSLAYLIFVSCCNLDICNPYMLDDSDGVYSALSTPLKGQRRSFQGRTMLSCDYFKRDGVLRLLGRLAGVDVMRVSDRTELFPDRAPDRILNGRRAVLSDFSFFVLSTLDDFKSNLKDLQVLPDGSAMFQSSEDMTYDAVKGRFSSRKRNKSAQSSVDDVTTVATGIATTLFECLRHILIAMTEKLFVAIPSLRCNDNISDEEENEKIELFDSYLHIVKHVYETCISSKGLFFIDKGKLSLYLAESLMVLVKDASHCAFINESEDINSGEGTASAFQGEVDLFVARIPDDTAMNLLTLLGQIYFDVFRLPVATSIIKYKGSSIQADLFQIDHSICGERLKERQLFESLFAYIKCCEGELGGMGITKSDIRASYGMIYQLFAMVRTPGRSGDAALAQRERVLLSSISSNAAAKGDSLWSEFFAASPSASLPEMYSNSLLQQFYAKLDQYGMIEKESFIAVNNDNNTHEISQDLNNPNATVVPFPARIGDDLSQYTLPVCKGQRHFGHPGFSCSPQEAQLYALVNVYINSLTYYRVKKGDNNIDLTPDFRLASIFLKIYEKVHALINVCLDDIGYNVFPVENLDMSLFYSNDETFPGCFSSAVLNRHLVCGTLLTQSDSAIDDITKRISSSHDGDGRDTISSLKSLVEHFETTRQYWDEFISPTKGSDDELPTYMGDSPSHRLFFNNFKVVTVKSNGLCFEALDDDERSFKEPLNLSQQTIVVLFAKLSSLIQVSENILQGLLIVFKPIKQFICEAGLLGPPSLSRTASDERQRKKKESTEIKIVGRLKALYESRCLMYNALLKVYSRGSTAYHHAQRMSILSALAGMELSSIGICRTFLESKEENEGNGDVALRILITPCSELAYPEDVSFGAPMVGSFDGDILDDSAISLHGSSTSYYFPFVYGKLIYQHYHERAVSGKLKSDYDKRSHVRATLVALRYLYHAQESVIRAGKSDKLEKKYRAIIAAELQKVRLSASMWILHSIHQKSKEDTNDEKLIVDVLNHSLLQEDGAQFAAALTVFSGQSLEGQTEKLCCADGTANDGAMKASVRLCASCFTPYEMSNVGRVVSAFRSITLSSNVPVSSHSAFRCNSSHPLIDSLPNGNICQRCSPDEAMTSPDEFVCSSNFSSGQDIHKRLWEIIVNSIKGLLHCKTYDSYDFRSPMILVKYIFGLSEVVDASSNCHQALCWAMPPPQIIQDLQEIGVNLTASWCSKFLSSRIFDKKRTQIVGIWVQENSALPFEQFLKRSLIYDYSRYKCVNLYLEVCHAAASVTLLSDLLAWTSSSFLSGRKNGCSALTPWLMRITALFSVHLHGYILNFIAEEIKTGDVTLKPHLKALFLNDAGLKSLYSWHVDKPGVRLAFNEGFERYWCSVDRYLAAGNRSALYRILGNVLVRYYNTYDTLCRRRFSTLEDIARSSLIDNARHVLGQVQDGCNDMTACLANSDANRVDGAAIPLPDLIKSSNDDSMLSVQMNLKSKEMCEGDITIESVLLWCRKNAEWQSKSRTNTSNQEPLAPALSTYEPLTQLSQEDKEQCERIDET